MIIAVKNQQKATQTRQNYHELRNTATSENREKFGNFQVISKALNSENI